MDKLFNIKNETDRITALYLEPGMKILDLGAGTGEYSLYFAKKGYDYCN